MSAYERYPRCRIHEDTRALDYRPPRKKMQHRLHGTSAAVVIRLIGSALGTRLKHLVVPVGGLEIG